MFRRGLRCMSCKSWAVGSARRWCGSMLTSPLSISSTTSIVYPVCGWSVVTGKGLRFSYAPSNKKGLHRCKPLVKVARPAGFEPTTPWFVVGLGNLAVLLNQHLATLADSIFRLFQSQLRHILFSLLTGRQCDWRTETSCTVSTRRISSDLKPSAIGRRTPGSATTS